jgi:hypothetical protein
MTLTPSTRVSTSCVLESTSRVRGSTGGLYKFSMPDGELAASGPGAEANEAEWASQTCLATWATQGVWPEGARMEDVNRCGLSNRGDWRQVTCDWSVAVVI